MVNNNNQNNWVPPKEWAPNISETATVSYYYPEGETNHSSLIQDGVYRSEKTNLNDLGYGPCSYSNPDCECYISQGLIPLHLACPATDCSGDGRAYQWIHHNCNGRIYINTNAYLRCMSCYTNGYITNWSFSCSLHPGKFWSTQTDDCVEALSTVLKLYPNKSMAIKKIIRQISNTLMDNDGGY